MISHGARRLVNTSTRTALNARSFLVATRSFAALQSAQRSTPHSNPNSNSHRLLSTSSRNMAVQQATMSGPGKLADLPNIAQLSPHVTRVLGQNPSLMTLQGTNTYLLQAVNQPQSSLILVDTTSLETADAWVDLIMSHLSSLAGGHIEHIVLTHRHPDHVGGLIPLLSALKNAGHTAPKVWKMPNPDEAAQVVDRPEWSDSALIASLKDAHVTPAGGPIAPMGALADGDVVAVDGVSVKAIPTPGHTADSISLVLSTTSGEGNGAVFTGDTVLGQGTTIFTDFGAYMGSLRRLLSARPTTIYPAHGPHTDNQEKCTTHLEAYIKHRQEREDKIVDALRSIAAEPGSLGVQLDKIREHAKESPDAAVGPGGAGGAGAEMAKRAVEAAQNSSPIADQFPKGDTPGSRGATLPLICRLVYATGHEGLIRAAGFTMNAHLTKLVEEGRVKHIRAKMPSVVDWKVTDQSEQDVFEWCGEEATAQSSSL